MDIINENNLRVKRLFKRYNPLKGEGSFVGRFVLRIDKDNSVSIPKFSLGEEFVQKLKSCKSVEQFCQETNSIKSKVERKLILLRLKYDFEYWCATCVRVQDKESKKIIPLILRNPQRKLCKILLNDLFANKPIRVILLKSRQWGGSTVVQVFMAWIQIFHKERWHSAIVADVEDQARNIKSMYSRLAQNHPKQIFNLVFDGFEGSPKNKIIRGRDSIIYIASMQNPDSLRSSDVMMAHLSEIGLWKQTEGKRPEDLMQSIAGTIPLVPFSVVVMESTAKGVGNYFHRQWQRAVNCESGYTPVFVAWHEIEIYFKPFETNVERKKFVESLSPQEMAYFDMGATLEGINWYRNKKFTEGYDDWRMCCEFPSNETEAFQSTGKRAHAPNYIAQMRKYCKEPKFIGELMADSMSGATAIDKTLRFVEQRGGTLLVWSLPDGSTDVKHRYVVSMDIGGRNERADWTVITVVDRYWLLEGGVEECVATYRFHLDQDLAIWKAVQTAKFYNNALLVVEANSLNPKGVDGDHSLTILDEIKSYYSNLYSRTDPQKIIEGYPEKYGFFTSSSSKTDLVNQMNKRYREIGYIERDVRALDEADMYEIKENGSFGAVEGAHDDIYMSRAIGLKASQTMFPPFMNKR